MIEDVSNLRTECRKHFIAFREHVRPSCMYSIQLGQRITNYHWKYIFEMEKRGEITAVSLLELGLIILFVVSAVIIGIALGRILNPSEQGNFESFRTITEAVDMLVKSDEDKCWDHFLITSDSVLAGFGKSGIVRM